MMSLDEADFSAMRSTVLGSLRGCRERTRTSSSNLFDMRLSLQDRRKLFGKRVVTHRNALGARGTAGIAANKPIAVASSASEIPGATLAIVASFMVAKPWNDIRMPSTVPNNPT